jgi:alkylation response protein AidB-like acyl-CoA dehydrogenase
VRALRFAAPGFDKGVFGQMGEFGWIGLAVDEAAGGAGLGVSEAIALHRRIGRWLGAGTADPCHAFRAPAGGAQMIKRCWRRCWRASRWC